MRNLLGAEIGGGAVFDGPYRYRLWRTWGIGPLLVWIMLNPSTADADIDDPTVRRCIRYAREWGYGGLIVVNLFGLRSTNPAALQTHADPIGPRNDEEILRACLDGAAVMCAWGDLGTYLGRNQAVLAILAQTKTQPYCLAQTKGGNPCHPLRLRADLMPQPYARR